MPYSHVTRTAYGTDAIAYARGHGSGHNGEENRNIFVAGVNMLPDEIVPFEQQMQLVWNKADPRHKTQIDRFIVSFSFDELDPDKPEDLISDTERPAAGQSGSLMVHGGIAQYAWPFPDLPMMAPVPFIPFLEHIIIHALGAGLAGDQVEEPEN